MYVFLGTFPVGLNTLALARTLLDGRSGANPLPINRLGLGLVLNSRVSGGIHGGAALCYSPHYILVATLALRWSVPLLGSVVGGDHEDEPDPSLWKLNLLPALFRKEEEMSGKKP